MEENNSEAIIFDERNVPISSRFDDPYFSFHDGLAESEYVFLSGNDIPERLQNGFQIAELGFGTGLNFLLTWQAWQNSGRDGKIYFTSFEAFPMARIDREKSLNAFPSIAHLSQKFLSEFNGTHFEDEQIRLEVIIGDARQQLPQWDHMADAWYLDGFSPAKNPELWEASLMQSVYEHTKPQGRFATYSAAGFVRKNLESAGFEVERIKGFGHKRHMTIGRKA